MSSDDYTDEDFDETEPEEKTKVGAESTRSKPKKCRVTLVDKMQPMNPEPEQKDPTAKDLKEEDKMNKEVVISQGIVIMKDIIKAWKTFNTKSSNLGMVHEAINPKVLKEKEGEL